MSKKDVLGSIVRALALLSEEFLGVIYDLLEKLSGQNGSEWLGALKKFLRKENPWGVREWKVWKTIKLGTGLKTAEQFVKALEAHYKVSDLAKGMMRQKDFIVSQQKMEVDLVVVSVAELGFSKDGACLKDIYTRAIELGLTLCPPEVGPQLRLQYKDQPKDEWLRIAMEAFPDSDGYLSLFQVVCDGYDPWLSRNNHGDRDDFWGGGYRFVFVRRRN